MSTAIIGPDGKPLLIPEAARETPLGFAEMPWLAGAIEAGGNIGPVLLTPHEVCH